MLQALSPAPRRSEMVKEVRGVEGMFRTVGQAIAIVRENRGISQYQLADRCRIGRSQVSKYERAKELMKLETLGKILAVLEIDMVDFFSLVQSLALKPPRRAAEASARQMIEEAMASLRESVIDSLDAIEAAAVAGVSASRDDGAGTGKTAAGVASGAAEDEAHLYA